MRSLNHQREADHDNKNPRQVAGAERMVAGKNHSTLSVRCLKFLTSGLRLRTQTRFYAAVASPRRLLFILARSVTTLNAFAFRIGNVNRMHALAGSKFLKHGNIRVPHLFPMRQ
jgi:hypothetical protein